MTPNNSRRRYFFVRSVPKPAPERCCAACGLLKRLAQFVASDDRCVDCRD